MPNFISPATVKKIGALLNGGCSHRAVARALGIKRTTVGRYAAKLQPEKCICGRAARHKGWCGPRYLKSSVHKELLAKVHADFVDTPKPTKKTPLRKNDIRMEYPYCVGGPGEGNALLMAVNAAVSKCLPDEARADICQEIILAILEGDLAIAELVPAVEKETKRRNAMFSQFGYVSLDAPAGTDGERVVSLQEAIPSDYDPIIPKNMRPAPGMTG